MNQINAQISLTDFDENSQDRSINAFHSHSIDKMNDCDENEEDICNLEDDKTANVSSKSPRKKWKFRTCGERREVR